MRSRVASAAISLVLSLFIAAMGTVICLASLPLLALSDTSLIDRAIDRSGYSEMLCGEIAAKWDNLAAICGIENRDELLALLTPDRVLDDSKSYFYAAYSGERLNEYSELRNSVYGIIDSYAREHDAHLILEEQLQANINELVDCCMEEYSSAVNVKFAPTALSAVRNSLPYLKAGIALASLLTAGLAVFIFLLQSRRKDTLYYLGISSLSVTLIFGLLCYLVEKNGYIKRIPFEKTALYYLITDCLNSMLNILKATALITAGLSLLILLAYVALSVLGIVKSR